MLVEHDRGSVALVESREGRRAGCNRCPRGDRVCRDNARCGRSEGGRAERQGSKQRVTGERGVRVYGLRAGENLDCSVIEQRRERVRFGIRCNVREVDYGANGMPPYSSSSGSGSKTGGKKTEPGGDVNMRPVGRSSSS